MMQFPSFVGGGFECSTHVRADGRRLDLVRATQHDELAHNDYAQMQKAGLLWARDGLRWNLIELTPGHFRWDSWMQQLDAAAASGISIWWDLLHFGVPASCDIWSPAFVDRSAAFAAAAAALHRAVTGKPAQFCPVNEISFMAFAGGEMAWMHPHSRGRGYELKVQLVRAAIAMARAIRGVDTQARLLWAEPLIHVACNDADLQVEADRSISAQYEALDWLLGHARPDLGGDASLADVIGWNFYPQNQWWVTGQPLSFGMPGYKALSELLRSCANRYPKHPMVLAETGAEGPARAAWLHYIGQECALAKHLAVPLAGACLYPVTHYPGWDDERICPTGVFGTPVAGSRAVDALTLEAVHALQLKFATHRKPFADSSVFLDMPHPRHRSRGASHGDRAQEQ